MKQKTLVSWSSGKDSAWALQRLMDDPRLEVVGLFSTVNRAFGRVAMHGVRIDLLEAQARSIGLPLEVIELPHPCDNAQYEQVMGRFVEEKRKEGVERFGFGDLFLEEVRRYREERLADSGIEPLFPLWGIPTGELCREMIRRGLKTVISCVDTRVVPAEFAGRPYDTALLDALPEGIDPCGENGEFHTFVFDGPMFRTPIAVSVGERVRRDAFVFADILKDGRGQGDSTLA